MTPDELHEARQAARTLLSDDHRDYLPGPLLPVLLGKFRDDISDVLGIEREPLPQGDPLRRVSELPSDGLDVMSGSVLTLVTRFASAMDDPELPRLLRELRDDLTIEKADRARIREALRNEAAT